MDYRHLRIVFMGTPEFAVTSLQALVEAGCNIAGVITAPDKPAGRGMKLRHSPVKEYALSKGLFLLQPDKLKSPDFLDQLRELEADLQIVVAFRMLPETVWNMPPMGTINVHASLLPRYRGAAPINHAIINGEKITGITTFLLKHEIDTGDILLQQPVDIGENETAGELHDRMKMAGARLLVKTISGLADGTLKPVPQQQLPGDEQKHAPKIFTGDCRINWELPVEKVHNLIRGLSPFPGAFTELEGKILKIYRSEKLYKEPAKPGEMLIDKEALFFACSDGFIQALEVQIEGKRKMNAAEFLRGFRPAQ